MALSVLTFLLVVTAAAILIVGILGFLVQRDFFLPITLNAVQRLGVSTGRVAIGIWLMFEIVVALYLVYIGFHYVNRELIATPQPENNFTLAEMIRNMGGIAIAVVVVLLIMSVYSIAIMVERYLTYRAARTVIEAELRQYETRTHEAASQDRSEIDRSKRAVKRAITQKTTSLKQGLSGLATIGSTAPFVGLFGTVFGIINAFREMKNAESAGIAAVAGGISAALFTTALGLLVAVPAVWLFNYFTKQIEHLDEKFGTSEAELFDNQAQ